MNSELNEALNKLIKKMREESFHHMIDGNYPMAEQAGNHAEQLSRVLVKFDQPVAVGLYRGFSFVGRSPFMGLLP